MAIINALTINVEDYFQAPAFQYCIKEKDWSLLSPRIEYAVDKILLLLSDHNVTATFFVYGWTIIHFPSMLKKIAEQGHELAYRHYSLPDTQHFNKRKIIEDLNRYKDLLSQVIGHRIIGYRSDTKLCCATSAWLEDELILAGYEYSCASRVRRVDVQAEPIESVFRDFQHLNVSTHKVLTKRYEIINTNSIRFRKYESSRKLVSQFMEETKTPVLGCISTWVMDNQQPNIRADNLFKKWLHDYHRREAPLLLHQLFSDYRWQTISDIYLRKVLQLNSIKKRKGRCVS
ncbi:MULTISPECIES: polysaccharide deacetylase family protein [unclassified Moritella]|uniref:polysaccharide deacetylase family protein n=1 Tax=unclassified Moritella TaxID=2637987 RepID=UPI001BAD4110|nr:MULTISPECIES: polysaccharide deacetylase family protein [unclassified Moritella]QUM86900.1 polysaccharide deacetylase family protein [Moritella sp. 28]QUM91123.1 polysaccharide deacetylase family protein [Moritella sp. 36]